MHPLVNLVSTAAACLFIWVSWKVYQRLRLSPLDNIAGPLPPSVLKGNFPQLFVDNMRERQIELQKLYGSVIKLQFSFGEKVLLVSDPKALSSVVKDQHIYEPLSSFIISRLILFGPGLFSTVGEQHRKQRRILNPVFSTAHLKEMTPVVYDVVIKLRNTIRSKVNKGLQEIELFNWMSRTALELIGQSGFGYSFDDLTEGCDPHPFAASLKRFDEVMRKSLFARRYLLPILSKIGTRRFQSFMVRLLPWESVLEAVEIIDTLHNTSVEIVDSRKRALAAGEEAMHQQVGRGKDIISSLLRVNERADGHDRLSDEEVIAQISTFTFAAMETTSSSLSRTFWILAQRQDAQDKLRFEIREAQNNRGNLSYDELMSLPYLDAVCKETLRLYPPLGSLFKTACHDTVLHLGTPIKGLDGTEINQISIEKGTDILVNVVACNNDPAIWGSDCYEWKPERWLKPLPDSVSSARIPGIFANLMSFMGGSRACIGYKFSQLEMKAVLSLLIESFRFSFPPDKEIYWRTQRVAKPLIVGSSDYQLPLVVERVV